VHERETTEGRPLIEEFLRGGPREGTKAPSSHDHERR
jgi:hypothetical protein